MRARSPEHGVIGSCALFFDQAADAAPDREAFGVLGGELHGIHAMHMHGRGSSLDRHRQRVILADELLGFVKIQSRHGFLDLRALMAHMRPAIWLTSISKPRS